MTLVARRTPTALALCAGLVLSATAATTGPAFARSDQQVQARAAAVVQADRLLRLGDRGADVQAWQQVLNRALGRSAAVAEDGIYGPQTRRATLRVQAQLGIAQDGVVGPRTRDGVAGLVDGGLVDGGVQPAPEQSDRLLRTGARGDDVLAWQRVLNRAVAAGHLEQGRLAEDGVFGPATARSTRALQAVLGVARDGVVGPVTRDGVAGLLDG